MPGYWTLKMFGLRAQYSLNPGKREGVVVHFLENVTTKFRGGGGGKWDFQAAPGTCTCVSHIIPIIPAIPKRSSNN